ncbi:MAG: HDOD domain-containing protein [Planctomycetes bacterium]|nr:HDOD domain-containing protein [Planctomycetota bacterium]
MAAQITGWITRGATTRPLPTPALPANREVALQAILHPSRLPSVPAVAVKVAEITTRPDCLPAHVGSVIAGDPGFSAALLQTVNCAREGAARTVGSVDRAVLVAGLNRVRVLALGLSLPAMRPQSRYVPAALAHSLTSIGGAIFARELAVRRGRPEPEEDLNAALLRDLGVLLIQQTFPRAWAELLACKDDPLGEEACAREVAKFGIHHAEVGAEALRRWGLPDDIVEPVLHHHHPDRLAGTRHADRAELLWFADLLTRLEAVVEHPEAIDRVLTIATTRFGLTRGKLADFLDEVRPKIDQFAEALNREIGRCPDYGSLLSVATDELSRLSPARG